MSVYLLLFLAQTIFYFFCTRRSQTNASTHTESTTARRRIIIFIYAFISDFPAKFARDPEIGDTPKTKRDAKTLAELPPRLMKYQNDAVGSVFNGFFSLAWCVRVCVFVGSSYRHNQRWLNYYTYKFCIFQLGMYRHRHYAYSCYNIQRIKTSLH